MGRLNIQEIIDRKVDERRVLAELSIILEEISDPIITTNYADYSSGPTGHNVAIGHSATSTGSNSIAIGYQSMYASGGLNLNDIRTHD